MTKRKLVLVLVALFNFDLFFYSMGNQNCNLSRNTDEEHLPKEVRTLFLYETVGRLIQQDEEIKIPLLNLTQSLYRLLKTTPAPVHRQELFVPDTRLTRHLLVKLPILPELQFWVKSNWGRTLTFQSQTTAHLNGEFECEAVFLKLIILPPPPPATPSLAFASESHSTFAIGLP